MLIVCVVYCWRKKHLKEDPDWKMPIPSRSASRSTLRNLGSDNADDDTIKKVRNYDATYRTHEPLEGKPDIDFPPKKMDLEEDDFTSSEGGSEYKDKVAKDFEYRNSANSQMDQPGRILGRRAERQKAIEEEDLPPPIDSSPPMSTPHRAAPGFPSSLAYSPTYGQDQRDSFMTDPSQSPRQTISPMQNNSRQQFFGSNPTSPNLQQSVGLPTASPTGAEGRSTMV